MHRNLWRQLEKETITERELKDTILDSTPPEKMSDAVDEMSDEQLKRFYSLLCVEGRKPEINQLEAHAAGFDLETALKRKQMKIEGFFAATRPRIEKLDRRLDIMRHFPNRLGRWIGADAQLWSLSSSMPKLSILLTFQKYDECLIISCGSPERICAPYRWSNSSVGIELDSDLFKVVDEEAGVLISNCSISLNESRKPWL